MEPDDSKAAVFRDEFFRAKTRIEQYAEQYRNMLRPEEAAAFGSLTAGLKSYFDALRVALGWSSAERSALGRVFMREDLQQRRLTMIDLANKVGQVNQKQLETGNLAIRLLFAQFRRNLIFLLLLTLVVGMGLAAISMSGIFRLEKEAAARYRDAQELSAKLVDAQEQERRSIARDLHDEVGQSLSALLLAIGNLSKTIGSSAPEATKQVVLIRSRTEQLLGVVRNMSLLLRPSMLDDLGLAPALQWQARETSRATGMRVSVAAESVPENLPDEYKTAIYRIVQEALHNCQKHSGASVVRVQLESLGGKLLVSVQDDGRGFRPENRGLGLLGMEERVKRFGGKLLINSEQGGGTLLQVELPKA